jgi:hypothetical protein
MRPVETILLDLYKATKNTDKLIRLDSLKTLPGKRLLLGCKHWLQVREVENCKSLRELKGAGESASALKKWLTT